MGESKMVTTSQLRGRGAPDVARRPEMVTTSQLPARAAMEAAPAKEPPTSAGTAGRFLCDILHEGALEGAPLVVIVGGGASLRDFDFGLLKGHVVIGTNRAFDYPNVGCVTFIDEQFHRWASKGELKNVSERGWADYSGLKVRCGPRAGGFAVSGWDETFTYPKRHMDPYVLPGSINGIGRGASTGFAALNMAVALGARKIALLGFDMKGDGKGKQAWFHPGYPDVQPESVYDDMKADFIAMAAYCGGAGIEVTNYGQNSALACFTKKPLTKFAVDNPTPKRPRICSYFTAGSPYEEEVRDMVRTARFFGFPVHVEELPSRGSWDKNILIKAEYLLKLRGMYPDETLIWLDADARIRRYPAAVASDAALDKHLGKAVVGTGWIDFEKFPHMMGSVPLVSSIVVARPAKEADDLLQVWSDINTESTRASRSVLDDQTLLDAMRTLPSGLWGRLGHQYSQIFDLMAGYGAPYIETMQASRRFKGGIKT